MQQNKVAYKIEHVYIFNIYIYTFIYSSEWVYDAIFICSKNKTA